MVYENAQAISAQALAYKHTSVAAAAAAGIEAVAGTSEQTTPVPGTLSAQAQAHTQIVPHSTRARHSSTDASKPTETSSDPSGFTNSSSGDATATSSDDDNSDEKRSGSDNSDDEDDDDDAEAETDLNEGGDGTSDSLAITKVGKRQMKRIAKALGTRLGA